MTIRMQRWVLAASAAGMLLASCSVRDNSGTPDSAGTNTTVQPRGRAAQRIELPGAVEGAMPGTIAATARRVLPEVPEVIRLPDGTVGVKVAAQYFDTIVACRQPDGSFATRCPPTPEHRP
jgi:hypothetical protein